MKKQICSHVNRSWSRGKQTDCFRNEAIDVESKALRCVWSIHLFFFFFFFWMDIFLKTVDLSSQCFVLNDMWLLFIMWKNSVFSYFSFFCTSWLRVSNAWLIMSIPLIGLQYKAVETRFIPSDQMNKHIRLFCWFVIVCRYLSKNRFIFWLFDVAICG